MSKGGQEDSEQGVALVATLAKSGSPSMGFVSRVGSAGFPMRVDSIL